MLGLSFIPTSLFGEPWWIALIALVISVFTIIEVGLLVGFSFSYLCLPPSGLAATALAAAMATAATVTAEAMATVDTTTTETTEVRVILCAFKIASQSIADHGHHDHSDHHDDHEDPHSVPLLGSVITDESLKHGHGDKHEKKHGDKHEKKAHH